MSCAMSPLSRSLRGPMVSCRTASFWSASSNIIRTRSLASTSLTRTNWKGQVERVEGQHHGARSETCTCLTGARDGERQGKQVADLAVIHQLFKIQPLRTAHSSSLTGSRCG